MASHSGAAEHAAFGGRGSCGMSEHPGTSSGRIRQDAWEGCLAFSNIGLAGDAVRGKNWSRKHGPRVFKLVTELFKACQGRRHEVLGVLLNEVGNMSDLLDPTCKDKFEDTITEAFFTAATAEPQIMWSPGETMAAFLPDVHVECLSRL